MLQKVIRHLVMHAMALLRTGRSIMRPSKESIPVTVATREDLTMVAAHSLVTTAILLIHSIDNIMLRRKFFYPPQHELERENAL
jgi:hypothetical protein